MVLELKTREMGSGLALKAMKKMALTKEHRGSMMVGVRRRRCVEIDIGSGHRWEMIEGGVREVWGVQIWGLD